MCEDKAVGLLLEQGQGRGWGYSNVFLTQSLGCGISQSLTNSLRAKIAAVYLHMWLCARSLDLYLVDEVSDWR